jgi:flagellar hook protein FlgE
MFSAISGLRNHQTYMDVVGNNIANVNTTGFKGSRVTFQDLLSQSMRGAGAPTATRGGINGVQIGLGAAPANIDTVHAQGNLQSTSKLTDLAIQGDGFFVLNDGGRTVFSRDGSFDLDSTGRLVSPATGTLVMGWQADATGTVNTAGAVTGITVPTGSSMIGQPTTTVTYTGNIDSATAAAGTVVATVPIYDSLGVRHDLTLTLTKTATANTWNFAYTTTDTSVTIGAGATGSLVFNTNGTLQTGPTTALALTFNNGAGPMSIANGGDFTKLTQLRSGSDVKNATDGSAAGNLTSFSISPNGTVTGVYSNGQTRTLAQVALATFANPAGLDKLGGNTYSTSASSGIPSIGPADASGRGRISSGFLEMSNVDLAQQFTNMIVAQRGFQANSRVVTTSDEMLQDLVNMKRG